MKDGWTVCHIGVGSNLGDAQGNVQRAIEQLQQLADTRLSAHSSLFRSTPIGAGGDDYINAVVRIETCLPAQQLLERLQLIERNFGRERPYRNAPRTLDLDLLLYGPHAISSEALTVPHPRMTQRAFVLLPLLQLDPFIAIPGMGPAHAYVPTVAGQTIQKI